MCKNLNLERRRAFEKRVAEASRLGATRTGGYAIRIWQT